MKLIIDIDEERYKQVCEEQWLPNRLYFEKAIANGIPLPKGHGRLIDINDIEWAKHKEERNHISYDVVDWDEIVTAPTIIESDRSEE